MKTTDWIQTITAIAIVVLTFFLVKVNKRLVDITEKYTGIYEKIADYTGQYVDESKEYVKVTREMVDEMKNEREERIKPYISVRICKVDEDYYIGLFNLGGSPADEIKVSYKPSAFKDFSVDRLYHKDQFFSHLAHESIFVSLQKPAAFRVVIKYKDRLGNLYSDIVRLKLEDAKFDTDTNIFLAIKGVGRWLEHISKNLEKNQK